MADTAASRTGHAVDVEVADKAGVGGELLGGKDDGTGEGKGEEDDVCLNEMRREVC
jgi:hypothetical protein